VWASRNGKIEKGDKFKLYLHVFLGFIPGIFIYSCEEITLEMGPSEKIVDEELCCAGERE
jgi:hypothetical protein